MESIFEILSTREIALTTWLTIGLVFCFLNVSIRTSLLKLLKWFFKWKISLPIIAFFFHTFIYVIILYKLGFWDLTLLKDTFIWTFGFGFVTLLNINKINNLNYFKNFLKDVLKWTIILEYFMNFFTFNLITELIILPIFVIAGMVQAKASFDQENKKVEELIKNVLGAFAIFVFAYSLYRTVNEFDNLIAIDNLKNFILPVILSVTFLPYLYFFNLLVKYETLWNILGFHISNKKERIRVKREILWIANFNINSVVNITKNIAKPILVYNDLSSEMIKTVSKGRYVGYDE